MPFKLKLIKQFQKYLTQSQKTALEEQKQVGINATESQQKFSPKVKQILRKTTNLYQMDLQRQPRNQLHIVNFLNLVILNEDSIRSEDCQEAYFRTIFYAKTIKKVENRPNYLVISLTNANFQFPPLEYTLNRFKSFGDQRFKKFADLMQQGVSSMKLLENYPTKNPKNDRDLKHDQVQAYVESLRKRMFCCKTDDKWYISKSLLELLEYDPQQLAIQLVKYRSSLHEAVSCHNYIPVMHKMFENLINLVNLLLDRISLQTFLDSSISRFRDTLYTKNNKKIVAKIKAGMPTPLCFIYELEEIISQDEEFESTPYFRGQRKTQMNSVRQNMRKAEIKSLRYILPMSENYFPENGPKVATYVDSSELCKQQAE